jgi:AraC-like DNA-binding protein
LYDPSIFIVASGRKRGFVGERGFVYDANNYLVLSVPLPFECETEVTDEGPMFGVSVRMDVGIIAELAMGMDVRPVAPSADVLTCVHATPIDEVLSAATVRLLECLRSPVEAAVLGPSIKREITYRVLCGPRGDILLAMLGRSGHAARIHAALRQMDARYAEPLSVARLALDVGMSVSALHHHFKATTASSPLQYLKALRLHKARALIHYEGLGAAEAADRVGYESASQFSREFKRFFGESPSTEARRSRTPPSSRTGSEPAVSDPH